MTLKRFCLQSNHIWTRIKCFKHIPKGFIIIVIIVSYAIIMMIIYMIIIAVLVFITSHQHHRHCTIIFVIPSYIILASISVPPKIRGPTGDDNVWVILSEPLTLECPAEGVPPPAITWYRHGQIIQRYSSPGLRLLENGLKLLIVSAQLPDNGDYECRVENSAGNASLQYRVNVYGRFVLYFKLSR